MKLAHGFLALNLPDRFRTAANIDASPRLPNGLVHFKFSLHVPAEVARSNIDASRLDAPMLSASLLFVPVAFTIGAHVNSKENHAPILQTAINTATYTVENSAVRYDDKQQKEHREYAETWEWKEAIS